MLPHLHHEQIILQRLVGLQLSSDEGVGFLRAILRQQLVHDLRSRQTVTGHARPILQHCLEKDIGFFHTIRMDKAVKGLFEISLPSQNLNRQINIPISISELNQMK